MIKNKRLKLEFDKINCSKKLIIIIFSCMFIGSLIGSILANTIDYIQQSNISNYMDTLFYNLNYTMLSKREVLIGSFLRYGISLIIIWLLGFIIIGFFFILLLIGFLGASLGFTTSFLIIEYGLIGIWYAIVVYIPQNILIIPLYVFIAYSSINFSLRDTEKQIKNKDRLKNKKKGIDVDVLEYTVVLILSLSLVFLVSLYEAYLAPNLINFMIFN